jgi:hypothetical protein
MPDDAPLGPNKNQQSTPESHGKDQPIPGNDGAGEVRNDPWNSFYNTFFKAVLVGVLGYVFYTYVDGTSFDDKEAYVWKLIDVTFVITFVLILVGGRIFAESNMTKIGFPVGIKLAGGTAALFIAMIFAIFTVSPETHIADLIVNAVPLSYKNDKNYEIQTAVYPPQLADGEDNNHDVNNTHNMRIRLSPHRINKDSDTVIVFKIVYKTTSIITTCTIHITFLEQTDDFASTHSTDPDKTKLESVVFDESSIESPIAIYRKHIIEKKQVDPDEGSMSAEMPNCLIAKTGRSSISHFSTILVTRHKIMKYFPYFGADHPYEFWIKEEKPDAKSSASSDFTPAIIHPSAIPSLHTDSKPQPTANTIGIPENENIDSPFKDSNPISDQQKPASVSHNASVEQKPATNAPQPKQPSIVSNYGSAIDSKDLVKKFIAGEDFDQTLLFSRWEDVRCDVINGIRESYPGEGPHTASYLQLISNALNAIDGQQYRPPILNPTFDFGHTEPNRLNKPNGQIPGFHGRYAAGECPDPSGDRINDYEKVVTRLMSDNQATRDAALRLIKLFPTYEFYYPLNGYFALSDKQLSDTQFSRVVDSAIWFFYERIVEKQGSYPLNQKAIEWIDGNFEQGKKWASKADTKLNDGNPRIAMLYFAEGIVYFSRPDKNNRDRAHNNFQKFITTVSYEQNLCYYKYNLQHIATALSAIAQPDYSISFADAAKLYRCDPALSTSYVSDGNGSLTLRSRPSENATIVAHLDNNSQMVRVLGVEGWDLVQNTKKTDEFGWTKKTSPKSAQKAGSGFAEK